MGKEFKYAESHKNFKNCPPESFSASSREGFRFVFDGPDIERNFSPVLILQKNGLWEGRIVQEQCKGYGLSFFDSEENAYARFLSLRKNSPQAHKRLGSFIAKIEITKDHGVQCEPSKGDGHFTVHEFVDAAWKWKLVRKLE